MVVAGIIVVGLGACAGLLGGLLARNGFAQLAKSTRSDEPGSTRGYWKRSLAMGLLASGTIVCAATLGGDGQIDRLLGLVCLAASFVSSALYVPVWLKLVTTFGPGAVESGELSLAVTLTLMVLLYVSGVLWMTLVILGAGVLLAVTVFNGVWIYRFR